LRWRVQAAPTFSALLQFDLSRSCTSEDRL
jgi:hypothetical protein